LGIQIRCVQFSDALRTFYALYGAKCARRGSGAKPEAFFARVAQVFGERVLLYVAERAGETLASVLAIHIDDYFMLADGSSLDAARSSGANNAVVWAAITDGLSRGATTIDLGVSLPQDAGNARFKLQMGARRTPIYGWKS
jgi:lipid II:glycine glycyltransferase (peptidoglycan interpeptide bridge formation enzyme)